MCLQALTVGCLQLDSRGASTAENITRASRLLEAEAARHGLAPASDDHAAPGATRRFLDVLLLPELAFSPHPMEPRDAWAWAEGLQPPERSQALQALRGWATRWGCYAGCTLLEAHADGHFYNTFAMATPDGGLLSHPAGSGAHNGCSVVRKSRAASLEAYVFRDGRGGSGGDVGGHVFDLDLRPLIAKRGGGGGGGSGGGGADGNSGGGGGGAGTGGGGGDGEEEDPGSGGAAGGGEVLRLRVGVAICYENALHSVLSGLAAAEPPIALLLAPFCAMVPQQDHPTFGWAPWKSKWFEEGMAELPGAHAQALRAHVAYCNHCGPYATELPRLLPLPRWLAALAPQSAPPLRSSFIGRSGVFAPDGSALARAGKSEERLVIADVPIPPSPAAPAGGAAGGERADAPAAAGGGETGGGRAAPRKLPYRRHFGDQVVEGAPWEVRYGFPIVEALGRLAYALHPDRAAAAGAIAAGGAWPGGQAPPVPAAEAGGGDGGGGGGSRSTE